MNRSKKRISEFLAILIFSTYFGSSIELFNFGGISIYLFRALFLIFAAVHIVYIFRHQNENMHYAFMKKYKNPIRLFALFNIVTVFFTHNISGWIDGQVTFVINVSLIYFVYYYTDSRETLNKYINWYMLGILMTIIAAIYEYSTGTHIMANNYIYSTKRSDWAIMELSKYPTAFLFNPNNVGVAMLIGAGYGLILLYKKKRFNKISYIVWIMACVFVSFATGSRGAIIFIIIAAILAPMTTAEKVTKKMAVMVVMVGVAFCLYNIFNEFIWDQLQSSGLLEGGIGETAADEGRWMLIRRGIKLMPDSLFLGVGIRTAEAAMADKYGVSLVLSIHNFWVELLVTNGIPGIITFIWLYLLIIKSQFKLRKYYYESSAILTSLVMFVIAGTIPPTIVTLHFIWLIFGFAFAAEKVHYIEYG